MLIAANTDKPALKRRALVTGLADVRSAREEDKENQARNDRVTSPRERKALGLSARTCTVCLDTICDEVWLECGHSGCRACVIRYLIAKVDSGEVFERQLGCPFSENCRYHLATECVRQIAPPGLFRKILGLRRTRWTPPADSGQALLYCTSPTCEPLVVTPGEERQRVVCGCGQEYCDHCHHPWHDGACPVKRGDMEVWLKSLARKHGWQCCPCCGALVEKRGGCNFMTCTSSRCNSLVHFCYLCGGEIGLQDHNSLRHFYDGPFGSRCVGQRRRTALSLAGLLGERLTASASSKACAIQ